MRIRRNSDNHPRGAVDANAVAQRRLMREMPTDEGFVHDRDLGMVRVIGRLEETALANAESEYREDLRIHNAELGFILLALRRNGPPLYGDACGPCSPAE